LLKEKSCFLPTQTYPWFNDTINSIIINILKILKNRMKKLVVLSLTRLQNLEVGQHVKGVLKGIADLESGLITDDCALLYTLGKGLNMKIHHNLFHDAAGRGKLNKVAGIYLDNDAADVSVHHNVVWNTEWSAIQINWNGTNIDVFNNTLINCSAAMGAWHKEGTEFSNVKVWNNLTNMNSLEAQADKQNNYIMTSTTNQFTALDKGDFTLKSGSLVINNGLVISGITDGFVGSNPDLGAYEFGAEKWKAGIDWDSKLGPTGRGCYSLPGEVCSNPTSTFLSELRPKKLKLFQDPVNNGKLTMVFPETNINPKEWQLYSFDGRMIMNGLSAAQMETVNMDGFKNGIYILRVQSGNSFVSEKVVKQ